MLACYGTQKSMAIHAQKKTASAAPPTKVPPTNIWSFQRACEKSTQKNITADSVIIYLMLHTAIKKKSRSIIDIWWAIQVLWSCDSPIRCWTSPCRSTTIDPMWLFFNQTKPCQSARCSCYFAHVKCSVFCVCHGLCSNNNIEDDNNDYEINHNLYV